MSTVFFFFEYYIYLTPTHFVVTYAIEFILETSRITWYIVSRVPWSLFQLIVTPQSIDMDTFGPNVGRSDLRKSSDARLVCDTEHRLARITQVSMFSRCTVGHE